MKSGAVPAGWTATQTGSGTANGRSKRRIGAEQTERVETIRSGHVPGVFQERHQHQRRFVEVKFKTGGRQEDQAAA